MWWIAVALAGPSSVVGGNHADPHEWPDTAGIAFGNYVGCTGTLIAPDVVITAGHCIGGIDFVVLNSTDWTDEDEGEAIDVKRSIGYNGNDNYDVGVLILEHPAETTPRTLALDCVVDESYVDGAPVAIVGFGSTEEDAGGDNTELWEAYATIGDADCSADDRGCEPSIQPGGEVIAGGDGIDSCNGDSGGPLYLLTDAGAYLAGVTSRASEPAENYCGDGGIYVRPDAVADWIEEVTGRVVSRPNCEGGPNQAPTATVEGIEVAGGDSASTTILVTDPDVDDYHSFVLSGSAEGEVVTSTSGVITYEAPFNFEGDDDLVIRVTDNGSPPLSIEVTIPVHVTLTEVDTATVDTEDPADTEDTHEDTGAPENGDREKLTAGCKGCSSGIGTGGALLWTIFPLWWRRRK